MSIGLIGTKLGMTREFIQSGQSVPVTVIKIETGRIVDIIEKDKRGYSAVKIGYFKTKNSKLTKQMKGYFTKKNTEPKKILKEYRVEKTENYKTGNELGLEILKDKKFVDVKNVNCTKIMSKIARSYTDRHGLKDLTKEFIGVEISKQQQSTDFGGNLTEKQLKYCATDVIYLHEIASKLKKILIRENRLELYDKAIRCIYTRVDLDLAFFTEDIWSH